jgi:hypothetical protein
VEFQFGLIVAGCCVDISGVLLQRNNGSVGNEDVSEVFETPVQFGSSGAEVLDNCRLGTACFRPHSHRYRNHVSPACCDYKFSISLLSGGSSLVSA